MYPRAEQSARYRKEKLDDLQECFRIKKLRLTDAELSNHGMCILYQLLQASYFPSIDNYVVKVL